MKTRVTVVFDGAKFDYEILVSKEAVLRGLSDVNSESGYIEFTDVCGRNIRINPSKIPLLEIVELEADSE